MTSAGTTGGRRVPAAGHRGTRPHNLSLVLGEVLQHGPRSRASIAESTGLTKATISVLVGQLIDVGLLAEVGPEEPGKLGRPGRLVSLNGDSVVGLGLEVNVDYTAVCALDLLGQVRHRRIVRTDNRRSSPEATLAAAARLARQAVSKVEAQGLAAGGVTLAVPGLVDVRTGTLLYAPNLGWGNLPVVDMLTTHLRHLDLEVAVDNEANLGALGELWEGHGPQWGDFVYISGEIGVGAALVVSGSLLRGFDGLAGEMGHIQVELDGPPCPCGSCGCLERFVGQEALLAAAGVDAELATTIGGSKGGSLGILLQRARAGDARTLEALGQAGHVLGRASANVVNLLNPATVVLGGIFAPLAQWIVDPLQEELNGRGLARLGGRPVAVAVSELGPDAAVQGAASSVLRQILEDPFRVPPRPSEQQHKAATRTSARGQRALSTKEIP